MNNKLYNVNTLKKVCSVDVKVNTFIITDDNLYVVVAMSDGRVVICDTNEGKFMNSYSHDNSVTALVVSPTNGQSNIIISGSTDGFIKRYTLGPLVADKRPLSYTHQVKAEGDSGIFSILLSQDETNLLVTTVKKTGGEDSSFNMIIYSSAALEPPPPPPTPTPPTPPPTPTPTPPVSNAARFVSKASSVINPLGPVIRGALVTWDLVVNTYRNLNYLPPLPNLPPLPPSSLAGLLPKEEPKHPEQVRVKYITLSENKRHLAFCTDGLIHIQKLEDNANPATRPVLDDSGAPIQNEYELDEFVIQNKFELLFKIYRLSPNCN